MQSIPPDVPWPGVASAVEVMAGSEVGETAVGAGGWQAASNILIMSRTVNFLTVFILSPFTLRTSTNAAPER
jgi:hypothetical protein